MHPFITGCQLRLLLLFFSFILGRNFALVFILVPGSASQILTWFISTAISGFLPPLLPVILWTFSLWTSLPVLLRALSPVILSTPTTSLRTWEPPGIILLWGAVSTSESTRGVAPWSQSSSLGTGPVVPSLVLALLTSLWSEILSSTLVLGPPTICLFCCCCSSPLSPPLPSLLCLYQHGQRGGWWPHYRGGTSIGPS